MAPREVEILTWMGDRLVCQNDLREAFNLSSETASQMLRSWHRQGYVEDSGQIRRASNNYPMRLFERTDKPLETYEEVEHNYEWRPAWDAMKNGEPRQVRGPVRKHRLED